MKRQWNILGRSIDWATQPFKESAYNEQVDNDHLFNAYVSYAGPGISKGVNPRINVPNSSGMPFANVHQCVWNDPYWLEVRRRIDRAFATGKTLWWSESFADVGMFDPRVVEQEALDRHMARQAELFKDNSSLVWNVASEVDEGGTYALERAIELTTLVRRIVHPDPVSFHLSPGGTKLWLDPKKRYWDAVDFVQVQDNGTLDYSTLAKIRDRGKPVLVVENQQATDVQVITRLRRCRVLGIDYVVTGRNLATDLSPELAEELRKYKIEQGIK